MQNFLNLWQSLPLKIDPEIAEIWIFSLRWYSIGYLLGFLTVFLLIYYRLRQKELPRFSHFKLTRNQATDQLFNLFIVSAIGILVGGRLGYFLIYDWQGLINNPIEIFLPLQNGQIQGYFGMSFHGGAIGALLGSFFYCQIKKLNFWKLSDFILPAIPLGYFWGRMGNFFNGELFGKTTEKPWGMHFNSSDGPLRHPTQLYEAFFEGLVIFLILWPLRNKQFLKGKFLGLFLIIYSFFRFFIEFLRQTPPEQIVFQFFTTGQILSLAILAFGLYLMYNKKPNI
ncbi:MAG: prolipoprotein diacylglyceryl transferase [Candidatus Moraniibacteriota bacterium]